MIKFLTSLTFLYAFSISVLLIHGFLYYKSFIKNGYQKKRFPFIFLLISMACFSFLYFNINASLQLKTFSNLDHHFIRHDGFGVAGSIELGRTDTVHHKGNLYNSFVLGKKNNLITVHSSYSEEPLYTSSGNSFKLLSTAYPAVNHTVSFQYDSVAVRIKTISDSSFEMQINGGIGFKTSKQIKKGLSCWNIFKDDMLFLNSAYYTEEKFAVALKSIILLRDNDPEIEVGQLKYFLSGRLFQFANGIKYDERNIRKDNIVFTSTITDKSNLSWGLGFADNNRNQFRVSYLSADSFLLLNRYPVSYPMSEENMDDWTKHIVNKFLISDTKDMLNMPSVFDEGFLFAPFNGDSTIGFSPVLLSYQKSKSDDPLLLQARFMNEESGRFRRINTFTPINNQLILPSKSSNFGWIFSIQNSFNWNFGKIIIPSATWRLMMFGTLLFFFIMIFSASLLKSGNKLSWIWQLLTCITMVLLTTRFLLYWRYKSFPPFEGLDHPSIQQLNSFWNFGIIIFCGVVLAIIFGFGVLKYLYITIRKRSSFLFRKSYRESFTPDYFLTKRKLAYSVKINSLVKKTGERIIFFFSWIAILLGAAGLAALNNFDTSTCRHLAIGLIFFYFIFLYISYKYSPLVSSSEKSWWEISTGKSVHIIINNPVKVLLSVSLLGLLTFIDIGFGIVFMNFLIFNEAFLCINYAIAGLSAGSKKNASLFGILGFGYLLCFAINLIYGPYILKNLLKMPQSFYAVIYIMIAVCLSLIVVRLFHHLSTVKKLLIGTVSAVFLFTATLIFFPKERILDKIGITRYRIDVMTKPVGEAIETAYEAGSNYEPVIRAAQNQWFINTFIYEKNNPSVNSTGFHLLPHAPQNKGAKYNAQATDLVTSRFLIAEHGRWSVLFYVLLLLLPATLLASFYKLYPDFTNRINNNYPTITAGFSVLNYLLITALLVILAATGRYIFFGQDLPFGSILSKQSILFPSILIVAIVFLFKNIPLENYPNQKKMIPGAIVFTGLAFLLFLVKPVFNRNKEFNVTDIAGNMDSYIEQRLQPLFDHFDTSKATRKLTMSRKDQLFTDSIRKLLAAGFISNAGKFFSREIELYSRGTFSKHLDQSSLLYLDLYSGKPKLAVNDNYFRIEPPPHLQQFWTGSIYSDTTDFNITIWNPDDGSVIFKRINSFTDERVILLNHDLKFAFKKSYGDNLYGQLCLINCSTGLLKIKMAESERILKSNDSVQVLNPCRIRITDSAGRDKFLIIQPDAFMRNYYVNGSRFYIYPMGRDFIWAKNFAESVSSEYTAKGESKRNAFVSLNAEITDSLSEKIKTMVNNDTAYQKGAEYGICIADGNGRLITMTDFIKDLNRPDPNDKAGFNKMIRGENGFVSQSLLRKEIGNINLLRMNPGPGSTLKPIVYTSIASQLNMDWDAFASEGFSKKLEFFGGEKVTEYDFEKNNGRIAGVIDYLKYSDNYYHSDLLLLGSYSRQNLESLLTKYFVTKNPETSIHWPYFSYDGKKYWLDGFENWPGYTNGKANFGSDSSFLSIGLFNNYGIYTDRIGYGFEKFSSSYDSILFRGAYKKSGFILPEYALFDQKATGADNSKPNEVFMTSFRGHVKGSSQVMIPPVKMLDAFGKMTTQSRNYSLTLNPYATENTFNPFYVDNGVIYSNYLSIIREKVFEGMKQALFNGTASRLGSMLKNGSPYYYYAKTGTTGDDESKTKSKLFAIIISKKDITDPDFNFRKNKFYIIYFTSQKGPVKQNEEFQASVIKFVQQSPPFKKYMASNEIQ